ncbi:MAG: DUF4339 domain-containing protein [Thermodesulfovibrionales bacterium]
MDESVPRKRWYYAVTGKQIGPISEDEIIKLISTGTIKKETMLWKEGMPSWTPAFNTELTNNFEKVICPPPLHKDTHAHFFPVSNLKLVVMSIFTFGLYQIYWSYENWDFIRNQARPKIKPAWRSLCPIFYMYSLFKSIKTYASNEGFGTAYSSGWLFIGYIVMFIIGVLPINAAFLSIFSVLLLLPVQNVINKINYLLSPSISRNYRFTLPNIIGIVLGLILWLAIFSAIHN